MRSESKPKLLFSIVAFALTGMVCDICPDLSVCLYPHGTARKVKSSLVAAENTEKSPPRAPKKTVPPRDDKLVWLVRHLSSALDYDEKIEKRRLDLIEMGEKVFPACEAILKDPKSRTHEIAGVLSLLRNVKADRRSFRKYAVAGLMDTRNGIRVNALQLLQVTGSPAEASPVVAMLWDEDESLVYNAAWTLGAIGGPNEVVALDIWLRGGDHRKDAELRKNVQKFRDDLKKRLAEKKDPTK